MGPFNGQYQTSYRDSRQRGTHSQTQSERFEKHNYNNFTKTKQTTDFKNKIVFFLTKSGNAKHF